MTGDARSSTGSLLWQRARKQLGRIRVRLLAVNLVVVLVPLAGLEFARVYERQLLHGLERDMENQASLVRVLLEQQLEAGKPFAPADFEAVLERAAERTRTRIRLIEAERGLVADSHAKGPPEGPEPRPPLLSRREHDDVRRSPPPMSSAGPLLGRSEIKQALAGARATSTRVVRRPSAVYLFLAEPVRRAGKVVGAVYVTRSTQPVLVELHRIRAGLIIVFGVTLAVTAMVTLALALSISQPLERLSRAARRVTHGDFGVAVPLGGGGEISELGREFDAMTRKLEARHRYISEFAADVAHELKSPLTSIRGAAELLSEGAADDLDARRRFLDNIRLDTARLERLVSRLLELSRIEASEVAPQVVELEALVRRAVGRSEGPNGAIILDYGSSVPSIMAREADLEAALLNLLDNALRFSPDGVPVRVTVSGRAGEKDVLIRVRDEGPGILPEHLPRVFDRFFTTDAERDGTGLGLSIVKSVMAAHGGSVAVESAPGQGTSVTLRLPVGLGKPRAHRRAPRGAPASASH